jgi:iron complex transport system substrate-binding protein
MQVGLSRVRFGVMPQIAIVVVTLALLFAVGPYATALAAGPKAGGLKAERVVSMNLCADQLLLLIAQRPRIASVSYLASDPLISHFADQARDIPVNHGLAEEILPLRPDLVLAGSYTTRPTNALLRQLGIKVLVLEPADGYDNIRRNMRLVGEALGEIDKVDQLIVQFDRALETPALSQDMPTAIILRPRGMTTGQGSLSDTILRSAGLRNISAELGVGKSGRLSLEQVVAARPNLFILGEFRPDHPSLAHLILRHPALRMDQDDPDDDNPGRVALPTHLWNCGGPQVLKAIDILKHARLRLLESGIRR